MQNKYEAPQVEITAFSCAQAIAANEGNMDASNLVPMPPQN